MPNESTYFAGGRGHRILSVAGSPAAGVNFSITLNSTHFHRLTHLSFVLTCDATVVTRKPQIMAYNLTTNYYMLASGKVAVASETFKYLWVLDRPPLDNTAVDATYFDTLPSDLIIFPGDQLKITVVGLQALDTITSIHYITEEYLAV